MVTRPAPLALVLAMVVLVAACSGSTTASEVVASPTTTSSPTSTDQVSTDPSTTAVSSTTSLSATAQPATTGPQVERPHPDGLVPLVPFHNDFEATRINLVLAQHNFPDDVDPAKFAAELLTWDGPVLLDESGARGGEPVDAIDITYGPFAIEPWRSNRDLFNVWFIDETAPSPVAWGAADDAFPIEIPNRLVVTMAWDWEFNSAAVPPSFIPPDLPEAGADVFVGLTLRVGEGGAAEWDATLAHELGHAVFGLADKYGFDYNGYDGRTVWNFYPACATDRAEAEEWFGDLIGVVDPFFETYVEELRSIGLMPVEEETYFRGLVEIGYTSDGCFGPEGVAIRSAIGGLMYNEYELPVMDAVNRRWSERVLDAWSGE